MRTYEQGQDEAREEYPLEEQDKVDDLLVIDPNDVPDDILDRIRNYGEGGITHEVPPDKILGVSQGLGTAGAGIFPPSGSSGPGVDDILREIEGSIGETEVEIPDLDLGQQDANGLLRTIASINLRSAQIQTLMLNVMRAQAQLIGRANRNLDSIEFNLRPFSSVTVSGTNDIEDADKAEPVVSDSEDTSIPTRLLLIRASTGNDSPIYIGDDKVAPQQGYKLRKGESQAIEVNLDEEQLYMAWDEAGQVVELLGLL